MTQKEPNEMLIKAQAALDLLLQADEIAIDLSNTQAVDYKEASALSTHFYNALAGVRNLIEHLEWQRTKVNRKALVKAIASTYQKYYIDQTTTAGVPYIIIQKDTGRIYGQPSVLPIGENEQLITKLDPGCFGEVNSGDEIEYFLTKVSPEWVDDIINSCSIDLLEGGDNDQI